MTLEEIALLKLIHKTPSPSLYEIQASPHEARGREIKNRMSYCARLAAEADRLVERELETTAD